MRRHAWWTFTVVATAAIVGYFALPSTDAQDLGFVAIGGLAAAGMLVGIRLHRPRHPVPWWLFLAGVVAYTLAQVNYAYRQIVLGEVAPFPSATEAFLLTYAACVTAGLALILRRTAPRADREGLLDAALLTTGAACSAWLMSAPWLTASGLGTGDQVAALSFPVLALLVLVLAIRLLLTHGTRIPAIQLLVLALAVHLGGYLWYVASTVGGAYRTGDPLDALLLAAPAFWAAAALHPTMGKLTAPTHVRRRFEGRRLILLVAAVTAAPATAMVLVVAGRPVMLPPLILACVLAPLLVLARMALAVQAVKEAQAQLAQTQRTQALGRLAGGIAHDFNNLLTAAMGHTELAATAAADGRHHHLAQALSAQQRAAALVAQLLTFSRGDVPKEGVVELNGFIDSMRVFLDRVLGESVELRTSTMPDPVYVPLDKTAVEQVVLNLALNARDAMPAGGELTIAIEVADGAPSAGQQPGTDRVRLRVTDTGTGMTPDVAARIFDPFFTTKGEAGTGLGMSTVHGIVTGRGGEVRVRSAPGDGTSVEVLLPLTSPPAQVGHRVDEVPIEPPPTSGATVLVVDDQDAVRTVISRMLAREGYTVIQHADGAEALRAMEKHEGDVDLLITDVVMPRLGGPELAAALRAVRPEVRVLYMSGYSAEPEVLRTTAGARFLQKPCSMGDLLRTVGELLGEAPPDHGAP